MAFRGGRTPRGILPLGQRVRVLDDYHFAAGHTGTIVEPPGTAFGSPWWRMSETERGTFRYYWVLFDELVPDEDEPGFYDSGDVDERWLELIVSPPPR